MDELVLMYERKKGIEEGIEKGIEKGMEKGMEKGIEKGMEKGKKEVTIKGIQKALQRGKLTIQEIAEDYEVSIEFVQQVQRGEVK